MGTGQKPEFDSATQIVQIEDARNKKRMLGVYVSPDVGSKEQFQILRQKSVAWAKRVRSQHLNGHETPMSYKQGIMKSLEFPTGSSYLNAQ